MLSFAVIVIGIRPRFAASSDHDHGVGMVVD
jgi:hypothetical protein